MGTNEVRGEMKGKRDGGLVCRVLGNGRQYRPSWTKYVLAINSWSQLVIFCRRFELSHRRSPEGAGTSESQDLHSLLREQLDVILLFSHEKTEEWN